MTEQELRKQVRWAAFEAGGNNSYAAEIGVSKQVLSLFLSGKRKPSKGLLAKLGYVAVTTTDYRRAA